MSKETWQNALEDLWEGLYANMQALTLFGIFGVIVIGFLILGNMVA